MRATAENQVDPYARKRKVSDFLRPDMLLAGAGRELVLVL